MQPLLLVSTLSSIGTTTMPIIILCRREPSSTKWQRYTAHTLMSSSKPSMSLLIRRGPCRSSHTTRLLFPRYANTPKTLSYSARAHGTRKLRRLRWIPSAERTSLTLSISMQALPWMPHRVMGRDFGRKHWLPLQMAFPSLLPNGAHASTPGMGIWI